MNLFVPDDEVDAATFGVYLDQLRPEGQRHGVALGEPLYDDDFFAAKLELVLAERVPVVSFTFGCPDDAVVHRIHDAGSEVWVTMTDPDEAALAQAAGADVLVAQGIEAGGHRGCFVDREDRADYGLLAPLALLTECVDLPLVAAGGISTDVGVAAPVRAAGRAVGDGEVVNLLAGQAYRLAAYLPAAEVIAELCRDLADAHAAGTRAACALGAR